MFWGRSKKILSWTCEKKKIRKIFSYQDIGGNYYQPMLHYIYEKEAEGPFHTRRDVQMPHKAEISSNKYSNMWVGKYTMAIYGFKKCIHCLSKKLDVVFGIRHIQKSEPVKTTAPLTTKSSIVNCLFNEKPDLVYHVKLYSTNICKLICTVTIKRDMINVNFDLSLQAPRRRQPRGHGPRQLLDPRLQEADQGAQRVNW